MTNTHPAIGDIVASVTNSIYRRYRQFVERDDLRQECWSWYYARADHFNELLSAENSLERVVNEKRITWQMRRHAERYCRREKAAKSGYRINDEAYYDTVTLAQLLPFVIKSFVSDTALEQSQVLVNDGQPRKPSAPAEGGNLLAMLVDIKRAYERLEKEEQEILRLRYHDGATLQHLAEYLECAISTADRRANNALRSLQDKLGGDNPFQ